MSATPLAANTTRSIASTRILRLSVGIALALAFSQAVNWPASFIVPVLVSVILTLPLAVPSLKGGIGFVLVLLFSLLIGLALLPALQNQPLVGVLLASLGIFGCFYYGASGGSPALATFALVGFSVVPVIGSESVSGALLVTQGLTIGAVIGVAFVWLAFAIFPDPPEVVRVKRPKPVAPPPVVAARSALRSAAIVLPVFYWLLVTSGTASYAVVLIKVATMGQQAGLEESRAAGRDLLLSTLIGGVAAIVVWNVLQIWPSLLIYGLLFLLCGLVIGPRIFSGAGMAPGGPTWSYGLLTMMVVLAPAAMDGAGGSDAGGRFTDRLAMFAFATIYAIAAVYAFDALWPSHRSRTSCPPRCSSIPGRQKKDPGLAGSLK